MEDNTTSGDEQGKRGPAPAGKSKFQPIGPDWEYNPKTPISYRPGAGEKREFVVALIKEKKSQQLAMDKCVELAMASDGKVLTKEVSVKDPEQEKEITRLRKELNEAQRALEKKPAPAPAPAPAPGTKGYLPTGEFAELLQKVVKARNMQSIPEALDYCIKYTAKNDWL